MNKKEGVAAAAAASDAAAPYAAAGPARKTEAEVKANSARAAHSQHPNADQANVGSQQRRCGGAPRARDTGSAVACAAGLHNTRARAASRCRARDDEYAAAAAARVAAVAATAAR